MMEDLKKVVLCKNCIFCTIYETNGSLNCRSMNGMYRTVNPDDFCSYGEERGESCEDRG